jgi:hypothetical protein
MAIQMAATTTAPVSTAEPHHADCLEHAATAADESVPGTPPDSDGHCHTCSACQVCSAVALAFAETAITLPALPQSVPRWTAARYTSADRALGQKPPIS